MSDRPPILCKFCENERRSINQYRDAITFECGAQCLYHEKPHGDGWSWWTRPPSCHIIQKLRMDVADRDIQIDNLKDDIRQMKEDEQDLAWEAWGDDN